jgi:hypothetical protein
MDPITQAKLALLLHVHDIAASSGTTAQPCGFD